MFGGMGGNGHNSIESGDRIFETLYGCDSDNMPSIYSMDYTVLDSNKTGDWKLLQSIKRDPEVLQRLKQGDDYCRNTVTGQEIHNIPEDWSWDTNMTKEEILIYHGTLLFNKVLEKEGNKWKPHLMGMSLGCAVAIAVTEKVENVGSLTLLDPFTSFEDAASHLSNKWLKEDCKGILAGTLGWLARNSGALTVASSLALAADKWLSKDRIMSPVFRNVPICILSGTTDTMVPSQQHNELYQKAARLNMPPPVYAGSGLHMTNAKPHFSTVGWECKAARMLVERKAEHMHFFAEEVDDSEVSEFFRRYIVNAVDMKKYAQQMAMSSQPQMTQPTKIPGVPDWVVALVVLIAVISLLCLVLYFICSDSRPPPTTRHRGRSRRRRRSPNRRRRSSWRRRDVAATKIQASWRGSQVRKKGYRPQNFDGFWPDKDRSHIHR